MYDNPFPITNYFLGWAIKKLQKHSRSWWKKDPKKTLTLRIWNMSFMPEQILESLRIEAFPMLKVYKLCLLLTFF